MGKVSGGHVPACLGKGWGEERRSLGGRCQHAVYVRRARSRESELHIKDCSRQRTRHVLGTGKNMRCAAYRWIGAGETRLVS